MDYLFEKMATSHRGDDENSFLTSEWHCIYCRFIEISCVTGGVMAVRFKDALGSFACVMVVCFITLANDAICAGIYYSYDALGQLVAVSYSFDRAVACRYDTANNLTNRDVRGATLVQPTLTGQVNPSRTTDATPTLRWNAASGATAYRLEIATDAAFQNVLYSTVVTGATSHVPGQQLPGRGRYYWRVRTENVSFISPWTVSSFDYVFGALPQNMLLLQ